MSRKCSLFKNGMYLKMILNYLYYNLLGDIYIKKIYILRGGQENKIDMVCINMYGSDCVFLWVYF